MPRDLNRSAQRHRRAELRRDMTVPETILWSRLRQSQLSDLKFRRQYGVGPYIVDFYCPRSKLAIEIDGDSHFETADAEARDRDRTAYLERHAIHFLRFTNDQIGTELDAVLAAIAETAEALAARGGSWWPGREGGNSRWPTTP